MKLEGTEQVLNNFDKDAALLEIIVDVASMLQEEIVKIGSRNDG